MSAPIDSQYLEYRTATAGVDKFECVNYRPITILNAAYKVLTQIILHRLSPLASKFVDGQLTVDQIFMVREILQEYREYQVSTHNLFIDFKADKRTIYHEELWKFMDDKSVQ